MQPQLTAQPSSFKEESKQRLREHSLQGHADLVKKQRVEHSTDVNRSQMQPIIKPSNVNFMSTISPDMMLQQPSQHQQAQPQLIDPFSKVNNPKARQLIQNLDKNALNKINVSQERRYDSTGGSGSEQQTQNNIEASQSSNSRPLQQNSGQYNIVSLGNNPSVNKQIDQLNRSFQNNPSQGSTAYPNQTQTGFYQGALNN